MNSLCLNLDVSEKASENKQKYHRKISKNKCEPEESDSDEDFDSAKISRRRRNKKVKYHHISNRDREEIITRVLHNGEQITKVAKSLNINYSTAKSILQVFRYEGRILKKDLLGTNEATDEGQNEIENSEVIEKLKEIPFNQKFKKKTMRNTEPKLQRIEKRVTRSSLTQNMQVEQEINNSDISHNDETLVESKLIKKIKTESGDGTVTLSSPKVTCSPIIGDIEEKTQEEKVIPVERKTNNELLEALTKLQNRLIFFHSQSNSKETTHMDSKKLSSLNQEHHQKMTSPLIRLPLPFNQFTLPFYIPTEMNSTSKTTSGRLPLEIHKISPLTHFSRFNPLLINPLTPQIFFSTTPSTFPINLNARKL